MTNAEQFTLELENDYEIKDYRGRYSYHGPAVTVESNELSEVLARTSVPCDWDNMGLGYVVYPSRPNSKSHANECEECGCFF